MSSVLLRGLAKVQDTTTRLLYGKEQVTRKMSFYECIDKDMAGNENYTELPQLYDEYHTRGLKILAFPCNQFGGQEPGSHEEILTFVKQFDADMAEKLVFFEKADVNGADAREVFSFLKDKLPNEDGTTDIRWNFGKFLVDHEGTPFARYSPKTPPLSMKDNIETLLKKKEG